MQGEDMAVGRSYAYRERRSRNQPMLKITLLDKVGRKGKLKIRFEDGPHPGLEEYISTRQVICPWGQRSALLRDGDQATRLEQSLRGRSNPALAEAAAAVMYSTGERGADATETVTWMAEDELQRIMDRAGLDGAPAQLHPLGYRDRRGDVHLPLDAMVLLARAFAAAEPQTVIGFLDDREEEYRLRGNQPGERWAHDRLREMAPGHALARQWAGLEQEAELLKQEIARLRGLVSRAAFDLKEAGKERKASSLLRAMDGW